MKIFLIKDLPNKGKAGQIVDIADGYARNFVIKNGYGRMADAHAHAHVKQVAESASFHKNEEIAEIKATIERLKSTQIKMSVKVGAGGKLFGSITNTDIANEVSKKGFNIDKKALVFDPIKSTGTYTIRVKFNHGLVGEFKLEVGGQQ